MDLRLRPRLALTLTSFHCRVRLGKKTSKFNPPREYPHIYPLLNPFFQRWGDHRWPKISGFDLAHLGRPHEDRKSRRLPIPGPLGPGRHLSRFLGTCDLPSGYVKIASENTPYIVDLPIQNGDLYVYQRIIKWIKMLAMIIHFVTSLLMIFHNRASCSFRFLSKVVASRSSKA